MLLTSLQLISAAVTFSILNGFYIIYGMRLRILHLAYQELS